MVHYMRLRFPALNR
ncbi:erythromycin resistance leader peptide [Halalkalibacter oceani]